VSQYEGILSMGDNFKWTDDDVLLIFVQHAYNLKVHEGESIGAKFNSSSSAHKLAHDQLHICR
jgi:hypothetical protein